ncbi:MAG TPA: SDR family oxidoreductase [Ktedonobacterales bacterium]|nr:SDR family oxidoreductase [Ktedonobacterales bacterium]
MTEQRQQTNEQMTELRGRVAIVTGASSGIGQAIAEALVTRGVHVAVQARRADRLHALAERLQADGNGEMLVVPGDVRQPEDVRRMVDTTLERFHQLDILVANAGLGYRAPLVESDIERWKVMLDTNVYGLLLTLKYGVPPMLERGRGHAVVMSSVAGRVATPGGSAYCGTKFAATAIADSLRQEVAARGVRVTTIEPGVVISEFQAVASYSPEILANMLKGAEPLVPADIARAVIFAVEQPAHFGINEVTVRPAGQAHP